MRQFCTSYLFSEKLAYLFTFWVVWLFLGDSHIYGYGRVISHDYYGAFIITAVLIFYLTIQAVAMLFNIEKGHKQLRYDAWISFVPLFFMSLIAVAWIMPEAKFSEFLPEQMVATLNLLPSDFNIFAMALSALVVIIDVFILGVFASDLVDYVKKCQLDAALMHRQGKAAIADKEE